MSCKLTHRGPDGEGTWTAPSGRAVLAHRRLAVIDLETGQQPMTSEHERLGLVFNGEIYNYRELRESLRREGVPFRTDSDTEVLLRLFARAGPDCLDSLRGMFAFAAWDDASGSLMLARDRIGKKPLFYMVDDGVLYFASSLRALVDAAPRRRPIDLAALDAYLALGYVPAPFTIYEGISKLAAGTRLSASARGVETVQYWSLAGDAAPPFEGSFDQAVDQLEDIVTTAVTLRLRSDVPLGVFLSGGIDSSLIAALAVQQASEPVRTFSIGMDVDAFDESAHAAEVARQLGTHHTTFRASPALLDMLPQFAWHFGEPFADSSALAVWLLAQRAREHVTVALGGDGGDEAFAGYAWYRTATRLNRAAGMVPASMTSLAGRTWRSMTRRQLGSSRRAGQVGRAITVLGLPTEAQRFAALRSFMPDADAAALYRGALRERRAQGSVALERLEALYDSADGSPLRRMRYVDGATYLADELMPKVDVATMAHGLEARAPLLDQELVRFAMGLPDEWLLGAEGGKHILRTLLYRHLPKRLFDRPKQGFTLPVSTWLSGVAAPQLQRLGTDSRVLETGWFAAETLRDWTAEHQRGVRDHTQRLFNLLMLEQWLAL